MPLLYFYIKTASPLVHCGDLVGEQRPDYIRSNLTLLNRESSRTVLQQGDVVAPGLEVQSLSF